MTLVELVVVIAIIGILSGLVLAFWPGVQDQQRSAMGASILESSLRLAKSRAARDQLVRGLRLIINNPASPATATATLNGSGVGSINLTSSGSGYAAPPVIFFTGGGGSGAQGFAQLNNGQVVGVQITSPGTGYTSAPTVNFHPTVNQFQLLDQPDDFYVQGYNVFLDNPSMGATTISFATPATATATIAAGSVTAVTVTGGGNGYAYPPAVIFSGGGGSGASAVAQFNSPSNGQVAAVEVNSGGTNYTSAPTVTFGPTPLPPLPLDFTQGQSDPSLWAVQVGDHLEINGSGEAHLITAVGSNWLTLEPIVSTTLASAVTAPATPSTPVQITLANAGNLSLGSWLDLIDSGTTITDSVRVTALSGNVATVVGMNNNHNGGAQALSHGISGGGQAGVMPGGSCKIIRAPRVASDDLLQLPGNIVVDLGLCYKYRAYGNYPLPYTLSNGNVTSLDILFAPSGTVVTPGVATDFLALWVRDVYAGNEFQIGPSLVAVYVRSGLIAVQPPNDGGVPANPPTGTDPYKFVKDGRAP